MRLTTILTIMAAALAAYPSDSNAEAGYPVPDLSRAQLVLQEKQYISDKEPPTEIDIKSYKGEDGLLVRTYGAGDVVFRYDLDTDGKAPYEYRVLDNDGDGVFETRETLVGEMVVQDKGRKYYVDLGPEPGMEYRYSYEDVKRPEGEEQKQLLMGYPIYIPQWVLLRFR